MKPTSHHSTHPISSSFTIVISHSILRLVIKYISRACGLDSKSEYGKAPVRGCTGLKASELAGRRGFEFRHVHFIIFLFAAPFALTWGLFGCLLGKVSFCQSCGDAEIYFTWACSVRVATLGLGDDKIFSRWMFHGYRVC